VVESLKIFFVCIVAAILIWRHPRRITIGCLEYFTVFIGLGRRLVFADGAAKVPLTGVLFIRQSR
jgi:hypothetical protein